LSLSLLWLKEKRIIHRDLKCSNILMFKGDKRIEYRVCDFGESCSEEDNIVESG